LERCLLEGSQPLADNWLVLGSKRFNVRKKIGKTFTGAAFVAGPSSAASSAIPLAGTRLPVFPGARSSLRCDLSHPKACWRGGLVVQRVACFVRRRSVACLSAANDATAWGVMTCGESSGLGTSDAEDSSAKLAGGICCLGLPIVASFECGLRSSECGVRN
jgi:hypothetical protein